jgi:hypothetical protein
MPESSTPALITVAAYCKPALASHPASRASLRLLRDSGVTILEGPESIESTDAGYRWSNVVVALTRLPHRTPSG